MSKVGGKILVVFAFVFSSQVYGQIVLRGKVNFERRTNLYKQFDDDRMRKMIDEKNKIKIDNFSLYFNDSISMFAYEAPEGGDPMSWMTMKNTVYMNWKADKREVYYDFWGTSIILQDSMVDRQWKITDKTRNIAGYECTRAIWEKNDTTNIYAWFTTDIVPTVGPEVIGGLPGAVLGLATEDGGIVYFATSVEKIDPTVEQLAKPKVKGKEYTPQALRDELTEKMKGEPYGERVIEGIFFWE